jgi:hypothetical protein
MIIIAHRGLLDGPDDRQDNHPDSIYDCLALGFHVEIDLWRIDRTWMLGHDGPRYIITEDFIKQDYLWIHAKNPEAAAELSVLHQSHPNLNFFWHQHDDRVLTSRGFWWTEPGHHLLHNSIAVLPEMIFGADNLSECAKWTAAGVCSDYGNLLRDLL